MKSEFENEKGDDMEDCGLITAEELRTATEWFLGGINETLHQWWTGDVGALGGFVGSVEVGFIRHGCCASSSAAVRYFFASSLVMYRRLISPIETGCSLVELLITPLCNST